jgi:hypothetical protein
MRNLPAIKRHTGGGLDEKMNKFVGLVNVIRNRDKLLRVKSTADDGSPMRLLPAQLHLGGKLGSGILHECRVVSGTTAALGYRYGKRENAGLMRRNGESLLELLLYVVGAVLEPAVVVFVVDSSVMLVGHLAAIQDEAEERFELTPSVARVMDMGR